jgi:hypothetical protein
VSYYSLPFEIVEIISHLSPAAWYSLTLADSRLGRYSLNKLVREAAQDHFIKEKIKLHSDGYNIISKYVLPNGKLHSNGDLPALIYFYKSYPSMQLCIRELQWYQNGKLHRDGDMPARINEYGASWYQYGERHRGGFRSAIKENNSMRNEIWRYGYEYDNYSSTQVTSYSELPLIIIIMIAHKSPAVWYNLVQTDPRLGRYSISELSYIYSPQDIFTTRTIEPTDSPIDGTQSTRVVYRLPNGVINGCYSKPAVNYACGLKKWYKYGKLHRIGKPAVKHKGHIKKWYRNGVLVSVETNDTSDKYNNDHYNK